MNLFFRAKHIAARGTDAWTKVGFALHLTLSSAAKVWREHKGDHIVFALEGGNSWRKEFYTPYKQNRKEKRQAMTDDEIEEDELFFEGYNALVEFLYKRSNCTVLQAPGAEGDDMIAQWTHKHPDDEHTIISSDTDFVQLLKKNISQYNGVTNQLHTINGIFDDNGKLVVDKKTGEPKAVPDPEWELFFKCIRGDKSDNIFSSFPGARVKGTKNKIGMREAFDDRITQGYNWNNFMLQRWLDHKQKEHKVLDDYNRNVLLVDLTRQPDLIKDVMDIAIANAYLKEPASQVGTHLLKFCGKWELTQIAKFPTNYVEFLNAKLPEMEL